MMQVAGRNRGLSNPDSQSVGAGGTVPDFIKFLIFFISALFLLSSCEKAGEEKASQVVESLKTGIYKIKLSPSYATKNSAITVKVKGVNPSDLSYQWIVNDTEIEGATEDILRYPELKKDDRIQVKVFIKDKAELTSEPLIISNIIPQIQTAKLIPERPKRGDELKVEVETFDEDGDTVSLSYEWLINEESSGETFDVIDIDGESIKRGDKVSVKITPTDGEDEGQSITVYTSVANSPPTVSTDIKARFEGNVYTSQVMAEDPDGDALTYALQKGPEGMKIDSESGVITWKVTPEDKGEHNIIVSLSDGHGGRVLIPFTTMISFTSPQ